MVGGQRAEPGQHGRLAGASSGVLLLVIRLSFVATALTAHQPRRLIHITRRPVSQPNRFYDRAGVAVIGASSWSEWPQTIFSGQISSSLDPKTSRIVETMIHMAMPAAMSGSKME